MRLLLGLLLSLPAFAATAQLKVHLGHPDEQPDGFDSTAAISSGNRFVVTNGADASAIIWDIATQREKRRITAPEPFGFALSTSDKYLLTWSGNEAILWDLDKDKPEGVYKVGKESIDSAGFSPGKDELYVMIATEEGKRFLFDRKTQKQIWRINAWGDISVGTFTASGEQFVAEQKDGAPSLHETAHGSIVRKFKRSQKPGDSDRVSVAPDGGRILATAGLQIVGWDATSEGSNFLLDLGGVPKLPGKASAPSSAGSSPVDDPSAMVAFSDDLKYAATAEPDGAVRVWDIEKRKIVRKLKWSDSSAGEISSLAFSPDGTLLSVTRPGSTRLWKLLEPKARPVELGGLAVSIGGVAFDGKGRRLLIGGTDGEVRSWDLVAGHPGSTVQPYAGNIGNISRGDAISEATRDGWDAIRNIYVSSNEQYTLYGGDFSAILAGADRAKFGMESPELTLSPDGLSFAAGDSHQENHLLVWSTQAPSRPPRDIELPKKTGELSSIVFSSDSKLIATAGDGGGATVLEAATGKTIATFTITSKADDGVPSAVAFSPDGQRLAVAIDGDGDSKIRPSTSIWDIASKRRLHDLAGADETQLLYIKAGLVTASRHKVQLWNPGSGAMVWECEGAHSVLGAVTASPDERWLVTASGDGGVRIYDTRKGDLLLSLFHFKDGTWAVVDRQGRYDAADPDSHALYWRVNGEDVELKQLENRYYSPNLLSRTLGFNTEPLSSVAGMDTLPLAPAVRVVLPESGTRALSVTVTDRGGGIGRMVVKVNGRALPSTTRSGAVQSKVPLTLDLSSAELRTDEVSEIEVAVYDKSNFVASREVKKSWQQKSTRDSTPPVLHAIVAGVSAYENPALLLQYPAKDALDIAHALDIGGKKMFGVDKTDIQVFATGTSHAVTKENLRKAFEAIPARSGPNDVVLVFLAGHGVAGDAGSDLYYYLTREATGGEPNGDLEHWKRTTVSSAELREWLSATGMPLRQVVVLDTCAAGKASGELLKLADRRELTADQKRALELLQDATGSHILMGAAADRVSYEASQFGQGLLTYSLLLGMQGQALDDGGRLDVAKWFLTAETRVPEFAHGIGGVQKPIISSPHGQSFPIGMFTAGERQQISLPTLKKQLLRAVASDADDNDPLHLEEEIRAQLRATGMPATRGDAREEPKLVYLDQVAGDVAQALMPRVRYGLSGATLQLRLRLESSASRKVQAEGNLTLQTGDPAAIAKRIVEEFIKMLSMARTE